MELAMTLSAATKPSRKVLLADHTGIDYLADAPQADELSPQAARKEQK
jgi:hypothetical protein